MMIITPTAAPTIIGMFVLSVGVSSPPSPSELLEEIVGSDDVTTTAGGKVPVVSVVPVAPVAPVAPGVETTRYTAHNSLLLDHLLYLLYRADVSPVIMHAHQSCSCSKVSCYNS